MQARRFPLRISQRCPSTLKLSAGAMRGRNGRQGPGDVGRGCGSTGQLPPQRGHLPKTFDFEGALARLKQRTSVFEGKDVDKQLTEVGHCIHLKNAFTDASDLRLFHALEKDIKRTGRALRLYRDGKHMEIFGDDLAGSTVFAALVTNMLALFDLTLVDCWAKVYRGNGDEVRFHHDAYQYYSPRPTVTIGLSLGETRDLVFQNAITNKKFRVPQQNGDIFAFDEPFNNLYKHAVPTARAGTSDGGRIAVIIWANEDPSVSSTRRLGFRKSEAQERKVNWERWPTMGQGELGREARQKDGQGKVTPAKLKALLQTLAKQDLDDVVITW